MLDRPFDQAFLRRLERLRLQAGRSLTNPPHGERRGYQKGSGLEFFDSRPYVPGDDPRYVDWNMFARLDRLIVKLFQAEESLCLHLLVDVSGSMGIGSPSKLDYALRAAAALAYIGLARHERVAIGLFKNGLHKIVGPVGGKSQFVPLLRQLAGTGAVGRTDFRAALSAYAEQSRMPGLLILLSDLLGDGDAYRDGIAALRRCRFEVRILHVLAEEELAPSLAGDVRLVDIETGEEREISADRQTLTTYAANLHSFNQDIEAYCGRYGITCYRTGTATPFEDLMFRQLRERRFLQ